jgi:hypothetical protein
MIVFINLVVMVGYLVLLPPVLEVAALTAVEQTPLMRLPRSIGYYALAFAMLGVIWASVAVTLRVLARGAAAAPAFNPEESVT